MSCISSHLCIGHESLYDANILHRDISENNIVLSCGPGERARAYLIDLDMAVRLTDSDKSEESSAGSVVDQSLYDEDVLLKNFTNLGVTGKPTSNVAVNHKAARTVRVLIYGFNCLLIGVLFMLCRVLHPTCR